MKFLKLIFKPIKIVLWLMGILLFLILSLALTLPMWIKPVVCNVANSTLPGVVKTGFTLNDFALNYFTGKVRIGELQLDNPEGYEPAEAIKLGDLSVKVDMPSVFTEVIVINNIELRDLFISYVEKEGVNNFDALASNMGIVTEAPAAEEEVPAPKKHDFAHVKLPNVDLEQLKKLQKIDFSKFKLPARNKAEGEAFETTPSNPKKVIIERIRISGITLQYGKFALPLPAVTLKDIGKESGGVDLSEALSEIWNGIISAVFSAGDMLKSFGESALKETKAQLEIARQEAEAQLQAARAEVEAQLRAAQEEAAANLNEAAEGITEIGTTTIETGSKTLNSTIDLTKGIGENTLDITKGLGQDAKRLGKEAEKLGKDLFKMLK